MLRLDLTLDLDGQTAARILIEHRQHFQRAAFIGPIENKIPGPHLVEVVCLSGQAGRHALTRYPLGFRKHLKAFFTSDPLNLFTADGPTFLG